MSLHLKCSATCLGLKCLLDLDGRNRAPGCAKDWSEMECCRMSVVRGFVYRMNRMGPSAEPCGTPKLSKVDCESLLLIVTVCVLLER